MKRRIALKVLPYVALFLILGVCAYFYGMKILYLIACLIGLGYMANCSK